MKNLTSSVRCERILKTAFELFVNNGYSNTSIRDIIKLSGGSINTLYKNFGSKDGLLKELIEQKTKEVSANIKNLLDEYKNADLKDTLIALAKEWVRMMKEDYALELKRIVMQENKNEQVALIFCENAMKPIFEMISDLFKRPEISKNLLSNDYNLLVFRFLNLLEEPIMSWNLAYNMLNNEIKPIERNEKWIENCVDFFLYGCKKTQ